MSDVSRVLSQFECGEPSAAGELLPLVYDELRRLAAAKLAHERPGQTLQATALVHEAYVRLIGDDKSVTWDGRGHFFAAAAEAMRRILVEQARRKGRVKHGGGMNRLPLEDPTEQPSDTCQRIVEVDAALDRLAAEDPRAAEVVKLHYFAGLSLTEVAQVLGISRASAYRNWTYARSWLRLEIEGTA